ncbi:MAG: hypothetical protein HYS22_07965 [Deltaproteobacteria bacterium]|nr:hypothetical protein [Deltaproteobacteria bacterium]
MGGDGRIVGTATSRGTLIHEDLRQNGALSVDGRWNSEGDTSVYGEFDGAYFLRWDDDRYTLIPGEAFVGLRKGVVDLRGGLLFGAPFWSYERFAGGRVQLDLPWIAAEVYGGQTIIDLWENGVPVPQGDNLLVGGGLAGGPPLFHLKVNYEQELETTGPIVERRGSYLLTSRPGWDRLLLFSRGKMLLIREGHEVTAGGHLDVVPGKVGVELAGVVSNLPPFFEFEEVETANVEDQRGRVAVSVSPTGTIQTTVAGEAGHFFWGGEVGANTAYGGASFLYRENRQQKGGDTGVLAYLLIPLTDQLAVRPYANLLMERGEEISGPHNLLDTGGRVTWTPWRELGLSAGGGYAFTPLTGNGAYAMVSLVAGIAAGSAANPPPVLATPLASQGMARSPTLLKRRRFGPLMKEATSFPHQVHLTDEGVSDANGGSPLTCPECHSPSPLIRLPQPTMQRICSNCHEWEEALEPIFSKLARVEHPGRVEGLSCPSCHGPMEEIEEPTGGIGTLVLYPHSTEVARTRGPGWQDHGLRQDASCPVCHAGGVSYKERTIPACTSCHDIFKPQNYLAQMPHPDGWRIGHVIQARRTVEPCTTCHSNLSYCRDCHRKEGVTLRDLHHTDFMRISRGRMRHGLTATQSSVAVCAVCHTPQEFQKREGREEVCTRCH